MYQKVILKLLNQQLFVFGSSDVKINFDQNIQTEMIETRSVEVEVFKKKKKICLSLSLKYFFKKI